MLSFITGEKKVFVKAWHSNKKKICNEGALKNGTLKSVSRVNKNRSNCKQVLLTDITDVNPSTCEFTWYDIGPVMLVSYTYRTTNDNVMVSLHIYHDQHDKCKTISRLNRQVRNGTLQCTW